MIGTNTFKHVLSVLWSQHLEAACVSDCPYCPTEKLKEKLTKIKETLEKFDKEYMDENGPYSQSDIFEDLTNTIHENYLPFERTQDYWRSDDTN